MAQCVLHLLQGNKWMSDLWIRLNRYLLCACQHGNISSVDSTGTGSCGAGQSDTLCLTQEIKDYGIKYIPWQFLMLCFINLSESLHQNHNSSLVCVRLIDLLTDMHTVILHSKWNRHEKEVQLCKCIFSCLCQGSPEPEVCGFVSNGLFLCL